MLAQQGVGVWAIYNGLGNGATDLTLEELAVQARVLVAISTTWVFSTTAVKLAVLGLYMRIFTTPIFKRWAVSLMTIDVCFGITFFVVLLTHCNPVSQEWNPVPRGSCRSLTLSEFSSIALNLALDTAIIILPMPWLYKLQIALNHKLFVMVMFSFGFATIAIMCYRLELTARSPSDPMIAIARVGVLSNLELWIGIIVACLPTMKPFVRVYLRPSLSKLSHKLYGNPTVSTKDENPQLQLRTFGGSGPSHPKKNSNYTELPEAPSVQTDTDELHLVPNESSNFDANCESSNKRTVSDIQGIYVQKQFQTSNV